MVRADGRAAVEFPRASYVGVGGEVRPCRGGDQFRGHSAVAAERHLLLGQAARPDVPEGQPCQSLLLRDLGFPLGVPRAGEQRFALVGGRDRAAGAERPAVGRLLRAPEEWVENKKLVKTNSLAR